MVGGCYTWLFFLFFLRVFESLCFFKIWVNVSRDAITSFFKPQINADKHRLKKGIKRVFFSSYLSLCLCAFVFHSLLLPGERARSRFCCGDGRGDAIAPDRETGFLMQNTSLKLSIKVQNPVSLVQCLSPVFLLQGMVEKARSRIKLLLSSVQTSPKSAIQAWF
jgi:hypothetical protein